jgi:hypothetical protein
MGSRILASCAFSVITLLTLHAIPAQAHHSFAMYDRNITKTFTGRLIRFIPGANHAQLIFELIDENGERQLDADGKPIAWGVETGPSASIARQGVTVKDYPVGTVLTVTLNPLRDGRTFGVQNGPFIHCGSKLPAGGCNEKTGTVHMAPVN